MKVLSFLKSSQTLSCVKLLLSQKYQGKIQSALESTKSDPPKVFISNQLGDKLDLDFESTFKELLTKDSSVTIHQRNLRALAIEMYKVSNKLSPPFMSDLFIEKNIPYNTRSNVHIDTKDDKIHCTKKLNFRTPKPKTTHYGLETIGWVPIG